MHEASESLHSSRGGGLGIEMGGNGDIAYDGFALGFMALLILLVFVREIWPKLLDRKAKEPEPLKPECGLSSETKSILYEINRRVNELFGWMSPDSKGVQRWKGGHLEEQVANLHTEIKEMHVVLRGLQNLEDLRDLRDLHAYVREIRDEMRKRA